MLPTLVVALDFVVVSVAYRWGGRPQVLPPSSDYCEKMKSHKFADYTYMEIKGHIGDGCLAIVTTGCKACLPSLPYHDIWCRVADPGVPGGHADSFTTSIAMFQRPATVRLEYIPSSGSREVNWDDPHLDFTEYSDTGVIGDATRASAELGRRLWHEVVSSAATTFRDAMTKSGSDLV